jgi:16S rRNA C967 or C1407 C5-methylase (RsmB/RsmF family)
MESFKKSKKSEIKLPDAFTKRVIKDIGKRAESILNSYAEDPVISLRLNARKLKNRKLNFEHLSTADIEDNSQRIKISGQAIPWTDYGYYLSSRPAYYLDPLFHAGTYYPQEASSMILEAVMKHIEVDKTPMTILDLCAAPGGKTTHILSLIPDQSVLLANEMVPQRYQVLNENIIKWGHPNILSTNHSPARLGVLDASFDVILVDAPCSGEGLFRKHPEWTEGWSLNNCDLCARRQLKILNSAFRLLKPGGHLLYSTCTLNPAENMDQLLRLSHKYGMESIEIPTMAVYDADEISEGPCKAYLLSPDRIKGEAFFIGLMQKPGDRSIDKPQKKHRGSERKPQKLALPWFPTKEKHQVWGTSVYYLNELQSSLIKKLDSYNIRYKSFPTALIKGKDVIPTHFAAMRYDIEEVNIPLVYDDALRFIRCEDIQADISNKGWHLLAFEGIALGWIKYDGRRINNKYPIKWRLRM